MNAPARYVGQELDLFANARNWKGYWSSKIRRHISGDVLEVGAGLGANTPYLVSDAPVQSWVALEPDPELAGRMREFVNEQRYGCDIQVKVGTVRDLPASSRFDSILYIDVLEHIEDDRSELELATSFLRPGGRIIVLAPAYQALFTPFDQALGHFRRYHRNTLTSCAPPGCHLQQLYFLDSVGLLASVANKLLLKQSMPVPSQVHFWDRFLVTASKFVDLLIGHSAGKSIVAVWERSGESTQN
jgi:SAM-dependent methyltransferase